MADDDSRTRTLAALRQKLTELDAKVVAFRRDRADEFRHYAADLLQNLPADEAADVTQTIDAEAKGPSFAALYPGFQREGEDESMSTVTRPPASQAHPSSSSSRRTASPPPVLYHTSGVPKEGPNRPHSPTSPLSPLSPLSPVSPTNASVLIPWPGKDRESDFRGVFTPAFLPLIDRSTYEQRSPMSPTEPLFEAQTENAAAQKAAEAEQPEPTPPPPVRRKSALRRSSSVSSTRSNNNRRVRFEFQGEEVLPTSSPPESSLSDEHEMDLAELLQTNRDIALGLYDDDIYGGYDDNFSEHIEDSGHGVSLTDRSPSYSSSSTSDELLPDSADDSQGSPPTQGQQGWEDGDVSLGTGDSAQHHGGSSSQSHHQHQHHRNRHSLILDDDDLEPLTRMSSSDRVRALSKKPLEDPSTWTVVNPQSDSPDAAASPNTLASVVPPASLSAPPSSRSSQTLEPTSSLQHSVTNDVETNENDDITPTPSPMPASNLSAALSKSHSSGEQQRSIPAMSQATTTSSPLAYAINGYAASRSTPNTHHVVDTDGPADEPFFEFDDIDGDASMGYPLSRAAEMKPYIDDDDDEVVGHHDADLNTATAAEKAIALQSGLPAEDDLDTVGSASPIGPADMHHRSRPIPRRPSEIKVPTLSQSQGQAQGQTEDQANDQILAHDGSLTPPLPQTPTTLASSLTIPPRDPTSPLSPSVGSYRGKPISMFNVVKDPRILEEAAQLGQFNSFVGSVDGRTGVDEDGTTKNNNAAVNMNLTAGGSFKNHRQDFLSGLNSFGHGNSNHSHSQGNGGSPVVPGTPRSFTERLAMEDAMEEALAAHRASRAR